MRDRQRGAGKRLLLDGITDDRERPRESLLLVFVGWTKREVR